MVVVVLAVVDMTLHLYESLDARSLRIPDASNSKSPTFNREFLQIDFPPIFPLNFPICLNFQIWRQILKNFWRQNPKKGHLKTGFEDMSSTS